MMCYNGTLLYTFHHLEISRGQLTYCSVHRGDCEKLHARHKAASVEFSLSEFRGIPRDPISHYGRSIQIRSPWKLSGNALNFVISVVSRGPSQ